MDIPISHCTQGGGFLFFSGIPPLNEDGVVVAPGNALRQAECIITKLESMLAQRSMTLSDLVYVQIFLRDIKDINQINPLYGKRFFRPYPARKVITTDFVSPDVLVEFSAIAYSGK